MNTDPGNRVPHISPSPGTPEEGINALAPIVIAAVLFSVLSLWAAVTSEGFLEADACTHYLYARFALAEPHYLVNVWGRPLCTAIYALPAALVGRIGVRVTSLLLALACAWIAHRIAKAQGYRWPALAFVFTLAQPLVFLHSFSELTELPFATLIGLAFWMYQKRWWGAMALLAGLSPLGRPEGFGFIFLAAGALVLHRRFRWLLVLPLPLILWNHAGWVIYGQHGPWWMWLPNNWPYAAESLYESGNLAHFLILLPVVTSPILFPAMFIGVWRSFSEIASLKNHAQRCQALIAFIPLLILAVHSILYWRGMMASNGELRYMLVVAPFWALLAAKGWQWIFEEFNWRRPFRWAAVAAIAPVLANFAFPVLPLALTDDWLLARRIANWYRSSDACHEYPTLISAHPAISYFLDISPATSQWHQRILADPPADALVIWDPIYSIFNADAARSITKDQLLRADWRTWEEGWRQMDDDGPVSAGEWEMFVSPRSSRK